MNKLQGIKAEKTDFYVPFGVFYIHKGKLMNENKLGLRYPSGATIKNIPAQIVSENIKNLIIKLLEDQKLDYNIMQKLSPSDRELFHNIVYRAKLDNQLGLSGYQDDKYQEQLRRFELLRGEILAGNNNPEIMKELKYLILNFMANGKMRKTEGNQILFELDNLIK